MKCKFCGSGVRTDEDGVPEWECGSHQPWQGEVQRTVECITRADANYRAMFPVAPWDDGPITAEVCERLGMVRCSEEDDVCGYRVGGVEVWFENIGAEVYFESGGKMKHVPEADYNSGQLALLVAARRAR